MSLNKDGDRRYLRVIPSDVLVPPGNRIAAQFHSVSLQSQIDEMQEQINQMREFMQLMTTAIDKLILLYDKEHEKTGTSSDYTEDEIINIRQLKSKLQSPYL